MSKISAERQIVFAERIVQLAHEGGGIDGIQTRNVNRILDLASSMRGTLQYESAINFARTHALDPVTRARAVSMMERPPAPDLAEAPLPPQNRSAPRRAPGLAPT